jgi:predicted DsbA family dithiol-disulfide isomerase
MAEISITEYTDPGCPWAFSAEPFRLRLQWSYGDQLEWTRKMVVLADSADQYIERGFTPDKQSAAFRKISREHGMPIDTSLRPRMAATLPACRAVVAARLNAPERTEALLRRLRVRHFSGELLDEPATIDQAATDAGLDPEQLRHWCAQDDVASDLERDKAGARDPLPAALALDEKLADWSGGRRYTCPSYEIGHNSNGDRNAVPGFQPLAAYEVVLVNLKPDLERRDPPQSVEQALAWAGTPLATQEVAVLCDLDFDGAREELSRIAREQPVGRDGFWSL